MKEYNCGFTNDNKWFRYRAAAIIVEDGCVLFAGNAIEDYYYSIGGAVHMGETAEEAVKREVYEETGIKVNNVIKLDTISSIPGINVNKNFNYKNNIYVVYEYAFGININDEDIKLSDEHEEYRWVNYEEAIKLLKYDSNKTALFELNERLIHNEGINNRSK